ncbi:MULTISPECIES: AAA family ATPase [unclassified Arcicella]|uniref:AAA family ATPase n=1 Tax=unclassified Arcicella TaxID=2644986 RepID=UPI00286567B2|nr:MULTISPECIES: AAA family ATPase [unclassified Arcicella]MDR6562825.1 putative ATP-binding protein involved in virulence [Arcicella sp. BE51]MDR6812833.1 putative ATP-binding protein involved in virulence [Arcicella sp. BE140]MDR6824145.1 putative ATP-binding protein involved in virulence [Arcicella sp. BE139]
MENFRIESLEINKIGAFEHLKMDFPKKTDPEKAEIHILTGENGTGKTTILEALVLLGESISDNEKRKIFNKSTHAGKESNIRITTSNNYEKVAWKGGNKEDAIEGEPQMGPKPKSLENYLDYDFNLPSDFSLLYFAMFAYSGNRSIKNEKIIGPKEIKDNPLLNSLDFNSSINTENLFQWIINTKFRELRARDKGDIKNEKLYKDSLKKLEDIISDLTDQKTVFDFDDNFNVLVKIDRLVFSFNILSDGLKSMISWIGDLLMRMDRLNWINDLPIFERNFILFLDEIEVHLHPALQRKILPVVQKLFKNAQIFISTHSPFVVGSVDSAYVHKLKKVGVYAVLDGDPILSEDGKSVRRILDEVFGINEQYGINVEDDLKKFRDFRQKIMMGQEYDIKEFDKLVKHLASQSTELEQMMGMEMNQLRRITHKALI